MEVSLLTILLLMAALIVLMFPMLWLIPLAFAAWVIIRLMSIIKRLF